MVAVAVGGSVSVGSGVSVGDRAVVVSSTGVRLGALVALGSGLMVTLENRLQLESAATSSIRKGTIFLGDISAPFNS
jgi:carbonic anhydrase/acetyltransferase-like protein (isoleucine patch superfamily)